MRLNRRALLKGASALTLIGAFGHAAQAAPLAKVKALGVLRVAVYKDNRPWSWNDGGKISGIDADIARGLAEGLGLKLDLAEFDADESVDDDLRNAVWRGGLLGFQPADVMLHVPFDRQLAVRNDRVAFVAPYSREGFELACHDRNIDCEAPLTQFRGKRIGVEMESLPDMYLLGAFGGILAGDLVHFPSGADAAAAMVAGKVDLALASRAQIDAAAHLAPEGSVRRRRLPLIGFMSPGWDVGMAVREDSRSLGDAIEEVLAAMTASGSLQAIFAAHGVVYAPALAH